MFVKIVLQTKLKLIYNNNQFAEQIDMFVKFILQTNKQSLVAMTGFEPATSRHALGRTRPTIPHRKNIL